MGRQADRQGDRMVMWSEMPRSPGHVFYDRLQEVLLGAGFDGFVEEACRAFYAKTMGAPSVPPGRYFRMHMVGYFEGIDSERGIEWRCSDSLSLREFLRLETTDRVPDHSWLSKTRGRLPHECRRPRRSGRDSQTSERDVVVLDIGLVKDHDLVVEMIFDLATACSGELVGSNASLFIRLARRE